MHLQKKTQLSLPEETELLLSVLSASLFGAPYNELQGNAAEWKTVFEGMRIHACTALPLRILSQLPIESELRSQWTAAAVPIVFTYQRHLRVQRQITALLAGAGYRSVILKGTSTAMYYPDPSLRAAGDIDILVKAEDFEAICALLTANGYLSVSADGRHAAFTKDGAEFELHRRFSDDSMTETEAEQLEALLSEAIDRAIPHTDATGTWYTMPDRYNGLVLLHHLRHHFATGIGLRQTADWMMYVHSTLTDELWPEFAPLAEKCGLKRLAEVMTRMCELYLGLPRKRIWCADVPEDLCSDLFGYIASSGNFGRAHDKSSRDTVTVLRRLSRHPLSTLHTAGLEHWNAARENPLLRPFAGVYQLVRYIRLGFSRKGNALKGFSGDITVKRTLDRLYKGLELNERE